MHVVYVMYYPRRCHWLSVFRCEAGATERLRAGHLIWSSARELLSSREDPWRMRRPGEGVLSQSGPGQAGNGLLNIISNVDMIQTRETPGGRGSERPGHSYIVTWVTEKRTNMVSGDTWDMDGGWEITPVIPARDCEQTDWQTWTLTSQRHSECHCLVREWVGGDWWWEGGQWGDWESLSGINKTWSSSVFWTPGHDPETQSVNSFLQWDVS